MNWIIGVDVGGTFTDLYAVERNSGAVKLWKRPSTPENPALAILKGLQELAETHSIELEKVVRFAHGTTVATNALIQRKGGSVALVTTRGFRDLVEIGRQTRPFVYDLQRDFPQPLVPRQRRFEVSERIDAAGRIYRALDESDIDRVIDCIRDCKADAVAICFLFSFFNPEHEHRVAERIQAALPGVHVSASADVQPEFREYERFTTTIINAYLRPALGEYMSSLEVSLNRRLPKASIGINQSSGGLMSIERAKLFPVRTALSGPAAGVVGARQVASVLGRKNVLTIDVGGTSADVSVIKNGQINLSYGRDVDGFPIRLPVVDIQTIGAGGGSIAWFDKDGLLKMGPQSAGADPGPACYGHGGEAATLSDANLVLGRLPSQLLHGAMKLDVGLARKAIGPIAKHIGKSVEVTAQGMIAISVANMVRAVRALSVERGNDPREFSLMPMGGAGPLHARDIAAALSIAEIVVPKSPGIICAQGLVIADVKESFTEAVRAVVREEVPMSLHEVVAELKTRGDAWVRSESLETSHRLNYSLSLDMRYVGQNFELSVGIGSGKAVDALVLPDAKQLKQLFFDAHDLAYSYHDPHAEVELVSMRLAVSASPGDFPDVSLKPSEGSDPTPIGERAVYFDDDRPVTTPVYDRADLGSNVRLNGPAIIEQIDTVVPIYPGDQVLVDYSGNLIVKVAK